MSVVPYAAPIPAELMNPGVSLPITVLRVTGEWMGNGLWNPTETAKTINGRGIVYPTTADELQALPEGERIRKSITAYWPDVFVIDDRILYDGEEYRVVLCDPWENFGYNRAIAQVTHGVAARPHE